MFIDGILTGRKNENCKKETRRTGSAEGNGKYQEKNRRRKSIERRAEDEVRKQIVAENIYSKDHSETRHFLLTSLHKLLYN